MAAAWQKTLMEIEMTRAEIAARRSRRWRRIARRTIQLTLATLLLTTAVLVGRYYYHRVVMQQRLEAFSSDLVGTVDTIRRDYPADWSLDRVLLIVNATESPNNALWDGTHQSFTDLAQHMKDDKDEHSDLRLAYGPVFSTYSSNKSAPIKGLLDALNATRQAHDLPPIALPLQGSPLPIAASFIRIPIPDLEDQEVPIIRPSRNGVVIVWRQSCVLNYCENLYQQHISHSGVVSPAIRLQGPPNMRYWHYSVTVSEDGSILAMADFVGKSKMWMARFQPNQSRPVHTRSVDTSLALVWSSKHGDILKVRSNCFEMAPNLSTTALSECPTPRYQSLDNLEPSNVIKMTEEHALEIVRNDEFGIYARALKDSTDPPYFRRLLDNSESRHVMDHTRIATSHSGEIVFTTYLRELGYREVLLTFSTDYGQTWFHKGETPQS